MGGKINDGMFRAESATAAAHAAAPVPPSSEADDEPVAPAPEDAPALERRPSVRAGDPLDDKVADDKVADDAAPSPDAATGVPPVDHAAEPVHGSGSAQGSPGSGVEALFEKLRAGQSDEAADASADDAPAPAREADATGSSAGAGTRPDQGEEATAGPDASPTPSALRAPDEGQPTPGGPTAGGQDGGAPGEDGPAADGEVADPDRAVVTRRDEALAPIVEELGRKGKRALQDEQNEVLDGLRRQRGRIDVDKVLPSKADQQSKWAAVLEPAIVRAYAAGGRAAGRSKPASPPKALVDQLVRGVVDPLRERVESSIAGVGGSSPADTEIGLAQTIGARYREWRSQGLESELGDAMAIAHARGVYDAAPTGARLRWVPAVTGKCPDCDDNALEPTVKGSEFPTGQRFPPAHPGCRCLLEVDQPL